MADKQIGPWPLGMDMLSTDENMPRDNTQRVIAARDSHNGDFTRDGWWDTRPGLQRLVTETGLHSFWSFDGVRAYGARNTQLLRVTMNAGALVLTQIATLPTNAPLDFALLNGDVVVCSRDFLGVIGSEDTVRPLSIPDCQLPAAAAEPVGGLFAGRYSVALSFVDSRGEEGALSTLTTVTLPEGGGIRLTMPAAPAGVTFAYAYRTETNGGKLYRAAKIHLGMSSFLLGLGDLGKEADTRNLRAMRRGDMVRQWNGRLLVAFGRYLYISEPMRYGLYSPRHGFVQFPVPIAFIEGVEGGIFVGLIGRGVVFLRGATPKEFVYNEGGSPPLARSSMLVQSNQLDPGLQLGGEVALWLSETGYVIGGADGRLIEPQADRIRLPSGSAGRTAVFDRRVLTIVTA